MEPSEIKNNTQYFYYIGIQGREKVIWGNKRIGKFCVHRQLVNISPTKIERGVPHRKGEILLLMPEDENEVLEFNEYDYIPEDNMFYNGEKFLKIINTYTAESA